MNVASAFFMRDLRVAWSYRFAFFFQNASLLFSVLTLRFVSDLIGDGNGPALEKYGGDYFSFVLVGSDSACLLIRLPSVFGRCPGGPGHRNVRGDAHYAHLGLYVVICSALYALAVACVQLALMWVIGGVVFGADFRLLQIPLVALSSVSLLRCSPACGSSFGRVRRCIQAERAVHICIRGWFAAG